MNYYLISKDGLDATPRREVHRTQNRNRSVKDGVISGVGGAVRIKKLSGATFAPAPRSKGRETDDRISEELTSAARGTTPANTFSVFVSEALSTSGGSTSPGDF
uniref:Uncharacterized protein n=1 Tax=Steinernema glaseri TaxID=37863 RepID=A0A1I8AV30_9BILA